MALLLYNNNNNDSITTAAPTTTTSTLSSTSILNMHREQLLQHFNGGNGGGGEELSASAVELIRSVKCYTIELYSLIERQQQSLFQEILISQQKKQQQQQRQQKQKQQLPLDRDHANAHANDGRSNREIEEDPLEGGLPTDIEIEIEESISDSYLDRLEMSYNNKLRVLDIEEEEEEE